MLTWSFLDPPPVQSQSGSRFRKSSKTSSGNCQFWWWKPPQASSTFLRQIAIPPSVVAFLALFLDPFWWSWFGNGLRFVCFFTLVFYAKRIGQLRFSGSCFSSRFYYTCFTFFWLETSDSPGICDFRSCSFIFLQIRFFFLVVFCRFWLPNTYVIWISLFHHTTSNHIRVCSCCACFCLHL